MADGAAAQTIDEALPQQDQGGSLPGQEAAAANVPSAQDTIEQSLYGEGGADALNQLRGAAPSATPAPTAPGLGEGPIGVGQQVLMGALSGNPFSGINANMQLQQAILGRQMLVAKMRQQTQSMAANDFDFMDKLKSVAPQYRSGIAQRYFADQGRPVPPEIANLLGDESVLARMSGPQVQARMSTDPAFAQMYVHAMKDPKGFLTLQDDLRKSEAETERSVNEARASVYAPAQAATTLEGGRLANAEKWRTLGTPLNLTADQEAQAQALGLVPKVTNGVVGLTTGAPAASPRLTPLVSASPTTAPPVVPPEQRAAADTIAADFKAGRITRQQAVDQMRQLRTAPAPASESDQVWNRISRLTIGQKPLSPAFVQHIQDAKMTYDLANDVEQIYRDPKLVKDRKALTNRLVQLFEYNHGLTLPRGIDPLIATQSLLGIAGARVYINGRPNEAIWEKVMEHVPKTPDSPERVLLKTRMMKNNAARQMQNFAQMGVTPGGDVSQLLPQPGAGAYGVAQPAAQ